MMEVKPCNSLTITLLKITLIKTKSQRLTSHYFCVCAFVCTSMCCVHGLVSCACVLEQAQGFNISDCLSCLSLSVCLLRVYWCVCIVWGVHYLCVFVCVSASGPVRCVLPALSPPAYALCYLQAALYPPRASPPCTPASWLC